MSILKYGYLMQTSQGMNCQINAINLIVHLFLLKKIIRFLYNAIKTPRSIQEPSCHILEDNTLSLAAEENGIRPLYTVEG